MVGTLDGVPFTGGSDPRGVSISDVSTVLGIPMPTLRSWELRYAMPTVHKEGGQHRRYLPAEVHALRMMRDEIASGHAASGAAATVRRMMHIGGPAGALIHEILNDSEMMDGAGIRRRLDQAAAGLGLPDCVDEVLIPAMRQVGIWWGVGHCDITQERITTEAVRGWLDKRIAYAPHATLPLPVLLACGPSDQHSIGLEALAMLLRYQGWPCRILGARTPTDTLLSAATATAAAGVVIVSQLATGRRHAVESIRAIRGTGRPVFYAGNSFSTARSRVGVPGTYLGIRIQDACTLIIQRLTPAAAAPGEG